MKSKKESFEINTLCEKCSRKCKQNKETLLVSCPKFKQKPQQLTFNFSMKKLNEG